LGKLKVDLTKFLSAKFKKNQFLQKTVISNLFELQKGCQRWCFDVHFDVFWSKVCRGPTLTTPPSVSFTAVTDHPTVGEWEKSCQAVACSPASVRIWISFWLGHAECEGWRDFSRAYSLTLSKWSAGATQFGANARTTPLDYTSISRETNLHLVKARSKLSGLRYLSDFSDSSSIRVQKSTKDFTRWMYMKLC
jgi:hypothetical protein